MLFPTWSHADTGFTLGVAPAASTRPLHTGLRSELGLPRAASPSTSFNRLCAGSLCAKGRKITISAGELLPKHRRQNTEETHHWKQMLACTRKNDCILTPACDVRSATLGLGFKRKMTSGTRLRILWLCHEEKETSPAVRVLALTASAPFSEKVGLHSFDAQRREIVQSWLDGRPS